MYTALIAKPSFTQVMLKLKSMPNKNRWMIQQKDSNNNNSSETRTMASFGWSIVYITKNVTGRSRPFPEDQPRHHFNLHYRTSILPDNTPRPVIVQRLFRITLALPIYNISLGRIGIVTSSEEWGSGLTASDSAISSERNGDEELLFPESEGGLCNKSIVETVWSWSLKSSKVWSFLCSKVQGEMSSRKICTILLEFAMDTTPPTEMNGAGSRTCCKIKPVAPEWQINSLPMATLVPNDRDVRHRGGLPVFVV